MCTIITLGNFNTKLIGKMRHGNFISLFKAELYFLTRRVSCSRERKNVKQWNEQAGEEAREESCQAESCQVTKTPD